MVCKVGSEGEHHKHNTVGRGKGLRGEGDQECPIPRDNHQERCQEDAPRGFHEAVDSSRSWQVSCALRSRARAQRVLRIVGNERRLGRAQPIRQLCRASQLEPTSNNRVSVRAHVLSRRRRWPRECASIGGPQRYKERAQRSDNDGGCACCKPPLRELRIPAVEDPEKRKQRHPCDEVRGGPQDARRRERQQEQLDPHEAREQRGRALELLDERVRGKGRVGKRGRRETVRGCGAESRVVRHTRGEQCRPFLRRERDGIRGGHL
ncbi:hypothetical protein DFJ74DRAFT_648074, partial [Hyaloraphidium curvatum]